MCRDGEALHRVADGNIQRVFSIIYDIDKGKLGKVGKFRFHRGSKDRIIPYLVYLLAVLWGGRGGGGVGDGVGVGWLGWLSKCSTAITERTRYCTSAPRVPR